MSEEELKPASPPFTTSSGDAAEEGAASSAAQAGAVDAVVPIAGAAEAAPVNKVHEWAAAAAIVVFLTLVLAGFVFFMRGASI